MYMSSVHVAIIFSCYMSQSSYTVQSKNILNYFYEKNIYIYMGLLILFFALAFIVIKIVQLCNVKDEIYIKI